MYDFRLETSPVSAYMNVISYMYGKIHERRVTMKKTVLALAALVALSGAAFAGETSKQAPAPAACAETTLKAKLDCTATGSVEKPTDPGKAATKGPRLGVDINPWIMPGAF
jgi:hypothetical protein